MAEQSAPAGPKKVRTRHFQNAKEQGIKITGLTSYDQLTASIFDAAGIDFLLVGDSAGNNVYGYDTTLPITVDELIPLVRAVAGAAHRAFVVADMPFGSYETSADEALHTAFRFMKETGAHAVKLEGGVRSAEQIRRIVS
ncbi:MAG: 3-methyl-2-oxobutanoate hydroxymethyltransferase, partial [Glaciihabitans sp.]|nr:3-methyl-2-oxobutanoate hydroxymethyltransferase [Glaciihabitans sp.]